MDGQDWQTVTLVKNSRKTVATSHAPVSASVAAARRLEHDN